MAMPVFFAPHLGKHLCLLRVVLFQPVRKIILEPRILLLLRNGQRENLLLLKTFERSHK
jgi:hypothetical protein